MTMIQTLSLMVRADARRMAVLEAVASLDLPDAWVTAGVIRNVVWDRAHGIVPETPWADIDVVYFDARRTDEKYDWQLERALLARMPGLPWSVRNQARMHVRNRDPAYGDSADALKHWVERCSAVGARSTPEGVEILAPFGVDEIFDLVVRPTPRFLSNIDVFNARVTRKDWTSVWPRLRIEPATTGRTPGAGAGDAPEAVAGPES